MLRLLVVEDDPLLRKMLERMLASADFEVLTASNGLEAILFVQSLRGDIDLLVSDIDMPEMDGTALAATMEISYPQVPILFIAGYCHVLPEGDGNPRPLLTKPFTRRALLDAVTRLLYGQSAQLTTEKAQASSVI